MKILQVTPFFSAFHGGSAEVPYQLSRELARRGHRVTVYTSDFQIGDTQIPGVTIRAFKTRFSQAKFYVTPGIAAEARANIKNFDVVHLHNYRTYQNIVVRGPAVKHGIPYVLQAHGSLTTFFQRKMLKKVFDLAWGNRILRDASGLLAVTDAEAAQYRSMGATENKIKIIPHGIDLAEFASLPERGEFRRKYGLGESKIVLFVGRLDNTKGLDLLARAFAGLARDEARLVIVGPDFGYLKPLQALIKELDLQKNIVITGPLYGREKLAAYADADVHVLPSSYEIFGITTLEAMACGTPVIVTDRCGLADAVKDAGLVIPHDEKALCRAMQQLLDNDKMRQACAEKGKLLVRDKFNWAKIAAQIEAVYEEAGRR
ncbi:MAG: glycosyltransferase [Dehalococcoidales bacterium]|nr:glycosyltransferase [Dehalococcoidales bacterium]